MIAVGFLLSPSDSRPEAKGCETEPFARLSNVLAPFAVWQKRVLQVIPTPRRAAQAPALGEAICATTG